MLDICDMVLLLTMFLSVLFVIDRIIHNYHRFIFTLPYIPDFCLTQVQMIELGEQVIEYCKYLEESYK